MNWWVSTHMPLARHDAGYLHFILKHPVSTHMPLARHDDNAVATFSLLLSFYSHASCEA